MSAEVIVLRLIHIIGGVLWVGATLFVTFFLGPVLAGMGPVAGQVGAGLMKRRMPTVMAAAAGLTVLTGLRLMMIMSSGFQAAYFRSPTGRTFAWGGVLALAAFVIGMAVVRPAMMRTGPLAQQLQAATDDPTRTRLAAELEATRKRGALGGMIVASLLVLAVAAMAVARYMG